MVAAPVTATPTAAALAQRMEDDATKCSMVGVDRHEVPLVVAALRRCAALEEAATLAAAALEAECAKCHFAAATPCCMTKGSVPVTQCQPFAALAALRALAADAGRG